MIPKNREEAPLQQSVSMYARKFRDNVDTATKPTHQKSYICFLQHNLLPVSTIIIIFFIPCNKAAIIKE